jgi:hypothetical protein
MDADAPLGLSEPLNEATRWMCSRVLVNRALARSVFDEFCVRHRASITPSPGVDLPALARHAAWAIQDDRRTMGLLSAAWLAVVAGAAAAGALAVAGGPWPVPAALALALAAGGVLWTVARVAERRNRGRLLTLRDAAEVIGVDLVGVARIRRLEEANDGNLIVYPDDRFAGIDPVDTAFPGFGDVAGQSVEVPVTVTRPLDPSKELGRVQPYELLRHLAGTVPRLIDRTEITHDNPASVVAHVRSSAVGTLPGLVDGLDGQVSATAPHDLVRRAADHPSRAVRAYVRAMAVGHSGQLVTTLHLSAVVAKTGLSLNFVIHVLRPLNDDWSEAAGVAGTRVGRWWQALADRRTWVDVATAPREWQRLRRLTARAKRPPRPPRRLRLPGRGRAAGGYANPLGRRHVATLATKLHFNERIDLTRHSQDLMHAAFTEVRNFLALRNIDPSALDGREGDAIKSVTANIANNVIGSQFDAGVSVDEDFNARVAISGA